MERPLAASPGTPLVYGTAGLLMIKDAMSVNDLHLDDISGHSPVALPDFLAAQAQFFNHPLLIIGIKGNRGLPLATVPTAGALENFFKKFFV